MDKLSLIADNSISLRPKLTKFGAFVKDLKLYWKLFGTIVACTFLSLYKLSQYAKLQDRFFPKRYTFFRCNLLCQ